MKKLIPFFLSFVVCFIFFWQFFLKGLVPIPADTIVGLYHPFRDLYAKDYPNGIPFKNFLITDPVRQQYPWKNLAINIESKLQLPLWNPYEASGKPLLANFQSGVFYPLNIIFLLKPFEIAWSLFIFLQLFLTFIFLYFFLDSLKIRKEASFLGAFVFTFCGFSIAWLEWGNIVGTALWLSLILLSIDKIFANKKISKWLVILTVSFAFSLLAGHLQTFFYIFIFSSIYFLYRWIEFGKNKKKLLFFLSSIIAFLVITFYQWLPTLKFISESARFVDLNWQQEGWFIPWQNIIQFVVPDFFGNPATLNYWGIWNYAEFIGYIGIFPLLLALFGLFFRRDKTVLLFGLTFFISLILSFPTFIAKIPYILNIPLISTAQPTRLIFLTDFSLAILSAFGLDYLIRNKKGILYPSLFIGIIFIYLWGIVLNSSSPNFLISKQNLIFPSTVFIVAIILLFIRDKKNNLSGSIICILIAFTIFDLFRFGWKFTPFTSKQYLFPQTKILSYLQNQKGQFRIMTTDSRILPPNFPTVYKIQSVDGYDPLYLERYGELIIASERKSSNINPPFGFNRIITPHNFDSKIIDLLGVKYILSLSDLSSKNLEKVFQEGQTQIYENKDFFPRAFFIEKTISVKDKNDAIKKLFINKDNLDKTAIVEEFDSSNWTVGEVQIKNYEENKIILETKNEGNGFLVLTDSFYPTWHAKIDGKETKIFRADFNFRGVVISEGSHVVEFYITLL